MKIYAIISYDAGDTYNEEQRSGSYWIHSAYRYRRRAEESLAILNEQLLHEQKELQAYYDIMEEEAGDILIHPDFERVNNRLCKLEDMLPMSIMEISVYT